MVLPYLENIILHCGIEMKINVISDLHLECAPLELPGGDILILSGDICEAKHASRQHYKKFFHEECAKYREVIYVMGNHEHYSGKFQLTYSELRAAMPSNVRLLENESYEVDGVLFIGATLWTDMNKQDPVTMVNIPYYLNDYKYITEYNERSNSYYKLTPQTTVRAHHESRKYISDTLRARRQSGSTGPVVVCTHHAPSFNSVAEKYRDDHIMNGAFYSDLEDLIQEFPEIALYTHGHTHTRFDYMIGSTRVVCNPRGYHPYESTGFDLNFTIEV